MGVVVWREKISPSRPPVVRPINDGSTWSLVSADPEYPRALTLAGSGEAAAATIALSNDSAEQAFTFESISTRVDVAASITTEKRQGKVVVTATATNNGNTTVKVSVATPFGPLNVTNLEPGDSKSVTVRTPVSKIPTGAAKVIATAPDGTAKQYSVRYGN